MEINTPGLGISTFKSFSVERKDLYHSIKTFRKLFSETFRKYLLAFLVNILCCFCKVSWNCHANQTVTDITAHARTRRAGAWSRDGGQYSSA